MSRLTELIDIDGMKIKTAKERPLSNQGLGAILHKLYKLEDLEDELGCTLEVVFKALKEGIFDGKWVSHWHLVYNGFGFCWVSNNSGSGWQLYLKDYGKTWWLEGDRSE